MAAERIQNVKLILASNSPRRRQLMQEAGYKFEVRIPEDIREEYPGNMELSNIPTYLAKMKASAFTGRIEKNEIIITADTIVILDDKVLGKPRDFDEAFTMLQSLSGTKHTVITGVCIKSSRKEKLFSDSTEVWFRKLSEQEITHYITEYKPYDKAGAYGVQEWIGYIGVERIEGSFFNIVGLPV